MCIKLTLLQCEDNSQSYSDLHFHGFLKTVKLFALLFYNFKLNVLHLEFGL